MDFLLIAATEAEIAPLIKHIQSSGKEVETGLFAIGGNTIKVLVSGVGMVATTYRLTNELRNNSYDLVIQAGIAGSFHGSLKPGNVVFVGSEQIGDLGAEDGNEFIDAFSLNLASADEMPYKNGRLLNNIDVAKYKIDLPVVDGITVNRTSGSDETIELLKKKYNCDIETMEGAALHYVCLSEKVPFAQIRAISNYIERRNKGNWEIETAIDSLNGWLKGYFHS